jgi:hypothetical protein
VEYSKRSGGGTRCKSLFSRRLPVAFQHPVDRRFQWLQSRLWPLMLLSVRRIELATGWRTILQCTPCFFRKSLNRPPGCITT